MTFLTVHTHTSFLAWSFNTSFNFSPCSFTLFLGSNAALQHCDSPFLFFHMAAWFAEDASLQMCSFPTNNYPCSPLQEAIRTWSRVLLSHLTITVLCSRLSSESYRGICHAGKLAVTKRSTSRHIICYFGPGVWQIMVTLRMSHWLQWLASYAENAEKPEWVIMSLLK